MGFVGEIEQNEEAPRTKKKGKKNKARRIRKESEESVEAIRVSPMPEEKTNEVSDPVKVEDKPSEYPAEANTGDFQVVTRRKVRKNSQSSSSQSGKSDIAVTPKGKGHNNVKSKSQRGFKQKVVPPRCQISTEVPQLKLTSPPQPLTVKGIKTDTPSSNPNTPESTALHLSSIRLDTKESLSALLSTKTLLEENISRLTDLVENKTATIDKIATDKFAKLEMFSTSQEELQKKKADLQRKAEEQRKELDKLEAEIEDIDLQLKKGGEKAARLTVYLDINLADAENELARLGKEKDSLIGRLDMVEDKLRGNRQKERLLNIHNQIQRLQTNLECPICLETAYNPIYQCREGHLVCSACVLRVARCAMCRQDGPVNIRNRYAENDSLELTRLLVERKEIMMALTGE